MSRLSRLSRKRRNLYTVRRDVIETVCLDHVSETAARQFVSVVSRKNIHSHKDHSVLYK
ncbi:MAG: hypothetical protein F6J89_14425 [Symploca sp. SIO1C4]|uniref:Uncharacterized protein n=1 Tax=Symploca sp. SIO1C4 TaxID=2607765 RepID=A0A6B3NGN2_9CYAN|nr:hypothetical protein [Symploca sp. SIO1C4]